MVKVAHLTSVHQLFDTRIFVKECRSLKEAGYDVTLVAPHETDDIRDGIRIKAVLKHRGRVARMTRTAQQVFRVAMRLNADIYHFHDPELILVGLLLKSRGKKVIYDVHEDVPRQILHNHSLPHKLHGCFSKAADIVETFASRWLDGIVAATPTIAQRFPEQKTVTVQNFPIAEELLSPIEALPYAQRSMTVLYIGGIGVVRGAREMIEAVALLPEELRARLVLAGQIKPVELDSELRNMPGWARTNFVGFHSRAGVCGLLTEARIGMVTLHPTAGYVVSYPVKLFEYMSAGIPIIASDFPLWREIVEGAQCGLLVDPLNSKAIAQAIEYLLTHPAEAEAMGRCGREAVVREYNWKHEEAKLLTLYERLSGSATTDI